MQSLRRFALSVCSLSLTVVVHAQCNDFGPAFGSVGVDDSQGDREVAAQVIWDDGRGPALYLAGRFDIAGDTSATNIARWDGMRFETLGDAQFINQNENFPPRVNALAIYDDGSGDALYIGGRFTKVNGIVCNGVAKWDGASWSAPTGGAGSNSIVRALAAYDDGSGSKLYVGGDFVYIADVLSPYAARWDGTTWENFTSSAFSSSVYTFAAHDDGSGPALFIAGRVMGNGRNIVKWTANGIAFAGWGTSSSSSPTFINSLAVFDDGSGPQLYAGGYFEYIQSLLVNHVARWDGTSWSAVANGSPDQVRGLVTHDDGGGLRLYLCAGWSTVLPSEIRRLDASGWTSVGNADRLGVSLCSFDPGTGAELFVGGHVLTLDGVRVSGIARWNGAQWTALTTTATGRNERVEALVSHDYGAGAALYSDRRMSAGDAVERWNGAGWTQLGGQASGNLLALASIDLGAGNELYAGGDFTQIGGVNAGGVARWNGSVWQAVGTGIAGGARSVKALARYDSGSGPVLVAGGDFLTAAGQPAGSLASWDGQAWSTFGGGTDGTLSALANFDSGSGPELYIGGGFTNVSGTVAYSIARWNGSAWSGVGNGANGHVYALAVFDDGAGPQLYVGGNVNGFDGVNHQNLARWDGVQWSAVPGGTVDRVYSLLVHDDGSGPALFAGGRDFILRWSGTSWSTLGTGIYDDVRVLASLVTSGGTRELWLGGDFVRAGTVASSHIARWSDACPCPRSTYCTAGTTSSGCVPSINGYGTASASASSGFVVRVDSVEGQKTGHIFYGISGAALNPWSPLSSSYLCVKAPSQRTGTQMASGTVGACDGVIQLDWNQYVATHPTALGVPFSAGAQVWAQLYFRDPPAPKTTNLSDGLTFTVCP